MEELNEKKTEEELKKKKKAVREKINKLISNKYSLYLVLILTFAFLVRLYFFYITKNQILWWDEAEYLLKAKSIALGTPDTGWATLRPPLTPFVLSIFIFLGLGEGAIKFSFIILSLLTLVLTYLLGKDLFDKKIALIGTLIFSMLYLNLFYTSRILTNIPEIFLGMLIFYLFYSSYKTSKNYIYLIIPLTILGFFIRFTVAIYTFLALVFILAVRDYKPLKEKKFKYSFFGILTIGIVGFIGTMVVLKKNLLSSFFEAFYEGIILRHPDEPTSLIFTSYIKNIGSNLGTLFLILFAIGFLVYFYKFFMVFDKKIKNPEGSKEKFFVLIWLLGAIIIYGLVINHFEDRYLLMVFPIISLITGQGIIGVYEFFKKYNKEAAIFIVVMLLIFGAYTTLKNTNNIIKNGTLGFADLKSAGLWIKQNSNPEDIVITNALPQNTYYSERETYPFSSEESNFSSLLEEKKPRYMILTLYQRSPPWTYDWPAANEGKVAPVQIYYTDSSNKQVSTVIYQFNSYNSQ